MRIRNTTPSLKSRTQTRTHLFPNLYVKLLIASLIVSSFLPQIFVQASGLDNPAARDIATATVSADPSPHSEYLWYEAEDMRGFATQPSGEPVLNPSWQNPLKAKAPGWGMNGTGTSAEWSQGGGSEWGSAAASADETRATIYQEIQVPRAGDYQIWVRYADWVKKTENFVVRIEQGNRQAVRHEFGARDMVDAHDELAMYWEWVFVWDAAPAKLETGPARISIDIEKAAEARRHVDAVLLTNDLTYVATGRRKPDFAAMRHLREWSNARPSLTSLLTASNSAVVPRSWQRPALSGRDFVMPWNISTEFWKLYSLPAEERPLYPFNAEPIAEFVKQYRGARDVPIFASKVVVPVIYVNNLPEYFREGSPFLNYLRETKTPFAVLINYGSAAMPPAEGQAAWQLLTGEFKDQFLGWISGESIGYVWDSANPPRTSPAMSRKELLEAHRVYYTNALARKWSGTFHTETGPMWDKLIPAQSSSSTSFAHPLMDWGVNLLGMESAAVQPMFGMRIAFNRGAARQFGGNFLYYHAPNFGDTATTFTSAQNFAGPNHFFHSRYGATMGPSLSWYRKSYYLYYMAGASAIFLEQGFDQFFKPGPGEHPFQLNPLGRITDEFIRFVEKHPDRGTPFTPIAFLLDPAHGWEMTDYPHWPFGVSQISRHDRALRQLFGVAYYPGLVVEGEPATADRQAFVNGIFGDIFDVLVATETIPAKPTETLKPSPTPPKQTKTEPEKNTRKALPTNRRYVGDEATPTVDAPVRSTSTASDAPRVPRVSSFKLDDYRAVVVGGHIEWTRAWIKRVSDYVSSGGTLVLNAAQIKGLPSELLGIRLTGDTAEADTARCNLPSEKTDLRGQMFRYEKLELKGAQPLITSSSGDPLVTVNKIGKGSVVFAAVPDLLGYDERITPFAAHMLAHLFNDATPVRVRGDVEYLINRNDKGWLVTLFNNNGVYKPAHGLAQVDRSAYVAAIITIPEQQIEIAVDWINEKSIDVKNQDGGSSLTVSIAPGAVSIIELRTQPGGRR